MLQSDRIPETEPSIRVGIILPQDKIDQIILEIPVNGIYNINSSSVYQNLKKGQISFLQKKDKIECTAAGIDSNWFISASRSATMKKSCGIKVLSVPAGRGFHWQKMIDVFLPGKLEFYVKAGYLLLVNELPLEYYLMCVATAEMSSACPAALLKAQTIAARSWMLANTEQKHTRHRFDVCNDDCCQRYQGSGNLSAPSMQAVENTRGQVLVYGDRICDARYSKSCGGIMEKFSTIWGGQDYDYLQVAPDTGPGTAEKIIPLNSEQEITEWIDQTPLSFCSSKTVPEKNLKKYLGRVDEEGKYFRWQLTYSQQEICALLNERLNLKARSILDFIPLQRGGSGRLIRLQINYRDRDGKECTTLINRDVEIRRILHRRFLYSSCIYFSRKSGPENYPVEFTIHGAGWGHGVGLCQIGALGMALQDYKTEDILKHYYPGSQLKLIYK